MTKTKKINNKLKYPKLDPFKLLKNLKLLESVQNDHKHQTMRIIKIQIIEKLKLIIKNKRIMFLNLKKITNFKKISLKSFKLTHQSK